MAAQDAAETVRELYAQARRGNRLVVGQMLSPDIEWLPVEGHPRLKPCHNAEEATQALVWRGYAHKLNATEVIAVGDRLVVGLRGRRLGLLGARGWRPRLYQVATVRGGLVVRMQDYPGRAEALAAVGVHA